MASIRTEVFRSGRGRELSASRAYYLKKTGEKEFLTVGAANRNTKDVFRERIARYVGDDPELAERIRLSSAIRSKTIQLLRDYDPTKY